MPTLPCPACRKPMVTEIAEDFELERCSACGGVFLDAGELNHLLVGVAGDMEHFSEPDPESAETIRWCPRCPRRPLIRARLLDLVEPEIEHCPDCGGWFLDAGEAELADAALRRFNRFEGAGDEEFRGRLDGRLVRLDRITDADVFSVTSGGQIMQARPYVLLAISVYLREPLDGELHVVAEDWTHWLAKLCGRFHEQDDETGDRGLDRRVLIKQSTATGLAVLRTPSVKAFLTKELPRARLLGHRLRWSIREDRVIGWSAPAAVTARYDVQVDQEGCVKALQELARRLESNRS